jgi:hypothetical protein
MKLNNNHIGQYITIKDIRFSSTSAGIYMGIKTSEHDGEAVHFFKDGHINGIQQTCFAFPVELAIKNKIVIQ